MYSKIKKFIINISLKCGSDRLYEPKFFTQNNNYFNLDGILKNKLLYRYYITFCVFTTERELTITCDLKQYEF